ncbi:monothiol glutaredoxin [Fragilaria crotonensis]|nr:monothiol glutaredoxin [Fragilaria crotonensis]
MTMARCTLSLLLAAGAALSANGFATPTPAQALGLSKTMSVPTRATSSSTRLFLSDDFLQQSPQDTRERIEALVEAHPVLLFMKGTQLFPQCGFSNTAVQILNTFNLEFHSVDVLADDVIRQGIKDYSQWPTIPQLYVAGEFIGGCDIMIEMYQSEELAELIEKAKANMM